MPYPLSPLAALAKAYPGLTSQARLQAYTRNRLPAELRSRGELVPIGKGTGRMVFGLGDDLVAKIAKMPRGVQENIAEGDWVAPVPEAVWKSDDDTIAVVRRGEKLDPRFEFHDEADKNLRNLQKAIELAPRYGYEDPKYSGVVQDMLEKLDWSPLLDYDVLWGDIARRNVGMMGERPLLLDAGILDRRIMDPQATRETISPADWASYRRDVLRAKKEGGSVKMAGGGLVRGLASRLMRQAAKIRKAEQYDNCQTFACQLTGVDNLKALPRVEGEPAVGDVLRFGDGRHYAVRVSPEKVLEVEGWGERPRVNTLEDLLREYDPPVYLRPEYKKEGGLVALRR